MGHPARIHQGINDVPSGSVNGKDESFYFFSGNGELVAMRFLNSFFSRKDAKLAKKRLDKKMNSIFNVRCSMFDVY
jgi:hypothetical protein